MKRSLVVSTVGAVALVMFVHWLFILNWSLVKQAICVPRRNLSFFAYQSAKSRTQERGDMDRNSPLTVEFEELPVETSGGERFPVMRDVRVHQPWPEVQRKTDDTRGQALDTVHWFWCGRKTLEMRHYLSVLSAYRVLQPLKIVLHYTDMPRTDLYNSWFHELRTSLPNLELKQVHNMRTPCRSPDTVKVVLGLFLARSGGVVMGENVVLTRFPSQAERQPFWFAFSGPSASDGVIFATRAVDVVTKNAIAKNSVSVTNNSCVSVVQYNTMSPSSAQQAACIVLNRRLYPRDFIDSREPFAEFARWLFYGRRAAMTVRREGPPIPRISHYVRIRTYLNHYEDSLSFAHFLSVLSALHVAGFQHVYVHADVEPKGRWWDELRRENVTFLPLVRPTSIFNQSVQVPSHVSDITRCLLLEKYGGVYQDWDVFWNNRVPDAMLRYPTVFGYDWVSREWPDNINIGVLFARARAHWIQHFLSTSYHDFRDQDWAYNSIMMTYRTWELYPETALLLRHLQILCHEDECHPTWLPGKMYPGQDKEPARLLTDAYAVHVTFPKPPRSMESLETLRTSDDVWARMGRSYLAKSGRKGLL